MIYCVWYPSGGFGHFVNSVLNSYGDNFLRPSVEPTISADGNSHQQELIAPTYFMDPENYSYDFDPNLNYSVLIDNGINNEGTKFKKFFPDAKTIKICYDDFSWPIVAKTMIIKAQKQELDKTLLSDLSGWNNRDTWVLREKYFLFLRDHSLRNKWKSNNNDYEIFVSDLMDYNKFRQKLPVSCDAFETHWNQWWKYNEIYFQPVITAQRILNGQWEPTTDVWTQAVTYYQIWCKYGVEVPHNDYSNWFNSFEEIVKMLDDHGVMIDSL